MIKNTIDIKNKKDIKQNAEHGSVYGEMCVGMLLYAQKSGSFPAFC